MTGDSAPRDLSAMLTEWSLGESLCWASLSGQTTTLRMINRATCVALSFSRPIQLVFGLSQNGVQIDYKAARARRSPAFSRATPAMAPRAAKR